MSDADSPMLAANTSDHSNMVGRYESQANTSPSEFPPTAARSCPRR
jgi:hypothetical protein